MLAPDDAFAIAESLAKKMDASGGDKLAHAIVPFSQRLSSSQVMVLAQVFARYWQSRRANAEANPSTREVRVYERLAVYLKRFGERMNEQDRRTFAAKWGSQFLSSGGAPSPSE